MKNNPTLYIMCGLPFSGKSTIARRLSKDFGWPVVEIDQIKTEMGLRNVWKDMKSEDWKTIFSASFENVSKYLEKDQSVIHDSANQSRAARDELREVAKKCQCRSVVIFIDIPVEVARARMIENRQSKKRMDLPEWAFDAAVSNYEPAASEEGAITLKGNDLDEAYESLVKILSSDFGISSPRT